MVFDHFFPYSLTPHTLLLCVSSSFDKQMFTIFNLVMVGKEQY